jgi:hypothetical protein
VLSKSVSLQFPLPSQVPPQKHGVPLGLVVHVPALPLMLQAWHAARQATLQQTPLAQFPDRHCPPFAQGVPLACLGTHCRAASQKASGGHSQLGDGGTGGDGGDGGTGLGKVWHVPFWQVMGWPKLAQQLRSSVQERPSFLQRQRRFWWQ